MRLPAEAPRPGEAAATGLARMFVHTRVRICRETLREHYWNGRAGRLARREVCLKEYRGVWLVEARRGDAYGGSRSWWFDSQAEARRWLARCLDDGVGGWRRVDHP